MDDQQYSIPRLSAQTADKLQHGHIICRESHWVVLKASGKDLREYLQGQITQDMKRLSAHQGIHACLLTPQGKAVSELYILEGYQDELVILTPSTTGEEVVARLRRFALGYTLRIGIVDSLALYSVQGATAGAFLDEMDLTLPENTWLSSSRHPQKEYLSVLMHVKPRTYWLVADATLFARKNVPEACELEALRIIGGLPRFACEWDASIYPLNANLIEFDGVSFDKGCYVGQEVTSRMHWRGGIRKKLYRVQIPGLKKNDSGENQQPEIPCPVISTTPLGTLRALACDHEGHFFGIALLPIETVESDTPLKLENGTEIRVIEACHV